MRLQRTDLILATVAFVFCLLLQPWALGASIPSTTTTARPASIEMVVPGNALIKFDGNATTQTGQDRYFISPPLAAGREYYYEVQIAWVDNTGKHTETRNLTFRSGDKIKLNYTHLVPNESLISYTASDQTNQATRSFYYDPRTNLGANSATYDNSYYPYTITPDRYYDAPRIDHRYELPMYYIPSTSEPATGYDLPSGS